MSMDTKTRKTVALAGSALLVAGGMIGAEVAVATPAQAAQVNQVAQATENQPAQHSQPVSLPTVQGTFSFTQAEVTPTARIAATLGAQATACAGEYVPQGDKSGEAASSLGWKLTVTGDTGESFTATLSELDNDATSVTMGCSCAGNPAGGLASANAEVTGATIASLAERAHVSEDANTVVFESADGYEVALPLSYVSQRHSLIAFAVNGEPLSNSVGGENQLWLGSTSARYFARDIVSVTFEARDADEIPAAPGTEGANVPNANVESASAA